MREIGEHDRSDVADGWAPGQEAAGGVPVRPAVSVIAVRDGSRGLETFLQHRVATMDFAAGVAVFPGGRVDAGDLRRDPPVAPAALLGAHARAWRRTEFAGSPHGAAAVLAGGLRELEEETGARLSAAALIPWANWITPPGRTRRFDTYFFTAIVREDVTLAHQTTEAHASEWMPVDDALTAEEHGELKLMRPTLTLLRELARLRTSARLSAEPRDIVPVRGGRPG